MEYDLMTYENQVKNKQTTKLTTPLNHMQVYAKAN